MKCDLLNTQAGLQVADLLQAHSHCHYLQPGTDQTWADKCTPQGTRGSLFQ